MKCGEVNCDNDATSLIYWPGKPPAQRCQSCAMRAVTIAKVLGIYLHVENLESK